MFLLLFIHSNKLCISWGTYLAGGAIKMHSFPVKNPFFPSTSENAGFFDQISGHDFVNALHLFQAVRIKGLGSCS